MFIISPIHNRTVLQAFRRKCLGFGCKSATPKLFAEFCTAKNVSEDWIAAFAQQVEVALSTYHIQLLGGDTVAAPDKAMFGLTLMGEVATGSMIQRAGAKIGDDIFVTGTIGHGFIGPADTKAGRLSPCRDLFEPRNHL